jgi:hypothetical protein
VNRVRPIIFTFGVVAVLTRVWAYPKIDQFIKVDRCLEKRGQWNYETQECRFSSMEERTQPQKNDRLNDHQLVDEQSKNTPTVSKCDIDLESENMTKCRNMIINNPIIDTTYLSKIWTLDPNGPQADFWFKRTEYYVVDYYGNGAMPYKLDRDSLTIAHTDFIRKGRIVSVGNDTLKFIGVNVKT